MIAYRTMVMNDIPSGLALCRQAGWNQVARDWELFLKLSPQGCYVATDNEGKVVGTVTTLTYQTHFSWIGMVLVDTEVRRQGIGTKLLNEALLILNHEETVKLDATPMGREVYCQLDFVEEYPISRMQITSVTIETLSISNAAPMQQGNLDEIKMLDKKVFGADRSPILGWLLNGAPHLAFITKTNGELNGFCFGRQGYNFIHIGPVVAIALGDAINLVSAVIRNCKGQAVILDMPHHSSKWNDWLSTIGFVEQRSLIRMYRGSNDSPGASEMQFAILGPEFG